MKEMEQEKLIEIEESPLRPIFCLKMKVDMKPFEKMYDCFILDFDPADPLHYISNRSHSSSDELSVLAEKGQVACRDYSHARHLCLKYPFDKTPHENFCNLLLLASTGGILNLLIAMPQTTLTVGSQKES